MAEIRGWISEELTEKELAAIGAVAVESAYLETSVRSLILNLARMSVAQADIFLARTMLDAKLTILLGVVELKLARRPKHLEKFKKIISDIRGHNDKRTTAIHGDWVTHVLWWHEPAASTTREPKAIKHKKGSLKELGLDETIKLAKDLKHSREELLTLAIKTWPRIFRVA